MDNLFIIIIFLVISLVLFSVALKKKLKGKILVSLLYIFVAGIIIGLGGFFANKHLMSLTHLIIFYLLSGWMLIFGITHAFLLSNILRWSEQRKFWAELFFTIITGLVGGIFMLLAFQISGYSTFVGIHLTSLLLFVIPYIFFGIVVFYIKIPVKVLRKWYYPVDRHIEEPRDREMESPLVVGFEFKKKSSDKIITTFRAKAPKEMTFGKLFYYFINDYNDRNPDEKIEYLDEKDKPVSWIFYFKPKLFGGIRYIDPEETNSFNLVKENSVILCKRVIET